MRAKVHNLLAIVTPTRFFVVAASVFGLLFLLITPPFQGADEVVHFFRSYQISEADFVAERGPAGKVGAYLPSDLDSVIGITDTPSIQFYPQLKYDERKTKRALGVPQSSSVVFDDFASSASYPPTAYPLSSVAIWLTRLLGMPTMVAFYAARLGNLVTWIILVGLAIHLLPQRKWALVAVGLLPMALFQASTLNGDAITIGSLALLLAGILHMRERNIRDASWGKLLMLLTTATVMVLSKNIMFLFLALFALLPREIFRGVTRTRLFKTALIILPIAMFLSWLLITRSVPSAVAATNGQDPAKQLIFIVHNPHSFINVLWNTYFYTWGDGITRSLIGTFGWADTPLSESIVIIGYVGLFLLLAGSYEEQRKELLTRRTKQLLALIGIAYALAVSAALYVYYSPVGFKIIVGLQGRYYLPIVLLAIPLLQTKKIVISRDLYNKLAIILPLFLLTTSSITLYVRYFIHNV